MFLSGPVTDPLHYDGRQSKKKSKKYLNDIVSHSDGSVKKNHRHAPLMSLVAEIAKIASHRKIATRAKVSNDISSQVDR